MSGYSDYSWMDDSLCIQLGKPDDFFPTSPGAGNSAAAREICAQCPVQVPCGEFARRTHNVTGVWGGDPRNNTKNMGASRGGPSKTRNTL